MLSWIQVLVLMQRQKHVTWMTDQLMPVILGTTGFRREPSELRTDWRGTEE